VATTAAPAPDVTGTVTQTAPSTEMAKPAAALIPPMSAPVIPAWKQEPKADAPAPEATPTASAEPAGPAAQSATEENKESHE
jgi:hypothetical protein